MSDTADKKPDADAEKRQREAVDKLLARAPVVSTGAVTLAHGRRLDYEVNAAFMPLTTGGVDAQRGEPQAAVFTVAYTVRDVGVAAAGVLRLQRRPGLGVDLAASRRTGPQARGGARRRHDACGAVCGAGQPAHLARALRPGVRRPAAHRLLGGGERRGAQEAVLGGWRRRCAVGGGARVAGAPQALRLGAVPGRRELRHHARRGHRRQAAGDGAVAVGPDPGVVRDGPAVADLRARQRPAVCAVPAGVRQHRAVPRPAQRNAGGIVRGGARRGRGVRQRGLSGRLARRRAARRHARARASRSAWPS